MPRIFDVGRPVFPPMVLLTGAVLKGRAMLQNQGKTVLMQHWMKIYPCYHCQQYVNNVLINVALKYKMGNLSFYVKYAILNPKMFLNVVVFNTYILDSKILSSI